MLNCTQTALEIKNKKGYCGIHHRFSVGESRVVNRFSRILNEIDQFSRFSVDCIL